MPIPVPLEPPDPRDLLITQLRQQVAERDAGIAARDSVIKSQNNQAATAAVTLSALNRKLTAAWALTRNSKSITKTALIAALNSR